VVVMLYPTLSKGWGVEKLYGNSTIGLPPRSEPAQIRSFWLFPIPIQTHVLNHLRLHN